MKTMLEIIETVDLVNRAGGHATVSACRRLTGMSHARAKRMLSHGVEKGLIWTHSTQYRTNVTTYRFALTEAGHTVIRALEQAKYGKLPF